MYQESHKACASEQTQLVNLTSQADIVLKAHNELRQRLANGKNMTLPRAARLVAMQWSEELAILASYNARMCQPKHDDCRNTANFKHSGQNIIVSTENETWYLIKHYTPLPLPITAVQHDATGGE